MSRERLDETHSGDNERLKEIEDLARRASKGPWFSGLTGVWNGDEGYLIRLDGNGMATVSLSPADRFFIAESRQSVPWLVAQVRERDAEIARLREALTEALDGWADAAQYKGGHLREKHGDAGDIARLRALLTTEAPDAA